MDSTNDSVSSELILLTFVLGLISIIINLYALYKKDNEFTGRILSPQGTLVKVDEYLEGDEGLEYMQGVLLDIGPNLNFITQDKDDPSKTVDLFILSGADKTKAVTYDDAENVFTFKASSPTNTKFTISDISS